MSEQSSAQEDPQARLVLRAVLRTDVGLVRSENQDFGAVTTKREERSNPLHGRLLIVADGMGGHRGGATASRLSVQTVKAQYLGADTGDVGAALRDALARANEKIYHEAQANPDLRGMGTTTSALVVRGSEGWIGHVGDSRIYRVRAGEIEQLTQDHSLVATMVREGLLTTQEAETHPRRNVLQRSMGVAEGVDIDILGPIDILEGDTFILCSDGLHGVVKEPELREMAQEPIEKAAEGFVRRALERGAPDNVTVIVARAETTVEPEEAIDDGLDETQPLDSLELADLDQGSKQTAKIPVVNPDPVPVAQPEPPASEAAPEPELDPDNAPTAKYPAPPKKSRFFKWPLVLLLALGAAGAWLYWTQPAPAVASQAPPDQNSAH